MTIQDLLDFIEANDGYKYAFRGWKKGQLEDAIWQSKDYKSFHEADEAGILWYVLAAPVKRLRNFHVNGVIIRKDARNTDTLNRMVGLFLKHYPGYTLTGDRGKAITTRRYYTPEQFVRIQQRHIYGQRT